MGFQERYTSVLPTGRPRSRRWPGPGGRPPLPSPSAPRPQSSAVPGRRRRRAGSRYCVIGGADGRRDPVSPRQTPWRAPHPPRGAVSDLPPSRTASAHTGGGHRLPWPPSLLPTSSFHSLAGRVLPPPGQGCTHTQHRSPCHVPQTTLAGGAGKPPLAR